jgi:hypothetical protein
MSWRDLAGSDRRVLAAAALGWGVLLVAPAVPGLPALCGPRASLVAAGAASWPLLTALLSPGALGAGAVAMCAAMMLPLAAPALRHVAQRAGPGAPLGVAVFLAGWLGMWTLALAGLATLALLLAAGLGHGAPVVVIALAVAWQHAPAKRRAARRCHACPPLPWASRALAAACARFGLATAARCVTGCCAVMLAALTIEPGWAAMPAAAALLWSERYLWRGPLAIEAVASGLEAPRLRASRAKRLALMPGKDWCATQS